MASNQAPSTRTPSVQECLRPISIALGELTADDRQSMATLHEWARQKVLQGDITGSDIDTVSFMGSTTQQDQAFDQLQQRVMQALPEPIRQRILEDHWAPELVYCRWAAPHTDNLFDGELFIQLVLGTGPGPYRIESLIEMRRPHESRRSASRFALDRATLEVTAGTSFLLDPVLPHYTCPVNPHQDSVLSLFQLRLPYRNQRERSRWIRLLCPVRAARRGTVRT